MSNIRPVLHMGPAGALPGQLATCPASALPNQKKKERKKASCCRVAEANRQPGFRACVEGEANRQQRLCGLFAE